MKPEVVESIYRFTSRTPNGEVYSIRIWLDEEGEIPKEITVSRQAVTLKSKIESLVSSLYQDDTYVTFDRIAQGILQFENVNAVEVMKVTGGLVTGREGVVLYKEWP